MLRKLVFLFIALPVAIFLIVLSVANRHPVTLGLDPFNADSPVFSVTLPFFAYLFGALLLGMLIGSMATWFKQGKHRKSARVRQSDVLKWQHEAEAQKKRAEELAQEQVPKLPSLPERAA
jgi:uncharacterized integral membrane protein